MEQQLTYYEQHVTFDNNYLQNNDHVTHLVKCPEDSDTAFNDILKCLLNVPIIDSRLSRGGRLPFSFEPFSCTSSGFISFGFSSILTIVGFWRSVISCVHERSVVGEDSDSGVKNAILHLCGFH